MLSIRLEQRKQLRLALHAAFSDCLVEHVRSTLPTVHGDTSAALLRARIAWALKRAQYWGLERQIDLQSFVVLALGVGPGLENHPVAREVLASQAIAAADKLDILIGRMNTGDWLAVRADVAPAGWPAVVPDV